MAEKISGIYCIENLVNHKKYIGQSIDIYKRWRDHKSDLNRHKHHSKHLQRAWDQYSSDNFFFYIIEIIHDRSLLNDKEMYYIKRFNTRDINYGYNLTDGGEGSTGYKHTEECKQWLSEHQKGRKLSEITVQHMKDTWQKKINCGYIPKTDHLQSYNEQQKEKVDCYNSFGEYICTYNGIHEAGKALNLEPTNICKVLLKKHSNIKGYVFYYSKDPKPSSIEIFLRCSHHPVILYNGNHEIIKIFHNTRECGEYIHIDRSHISHVCKDGRMIKQTYYCKYYYDVFPENKPKLNRKIYPDKRRLKNKS